MASGGRGRAATNRCSSSFVIPPLLASFVTGYPRINVEMETGLTAMMVPRLGKAFDLVIAMHPQGRGTGELLRRDRAVWAKRLSAGTVRTLLIASARGTNFRSGGWKATITPV